MAAERGLLRFLTCGSVDDGKSTLIGRLLHDTGRITDDQQAALARDSRKHGTTGEDLDLALLVDGLEAEREQGITIDVAYRYFSSPNRAFIVADTPGHEQYTRNMATGASNADAAVLLVDATKGVLVQTRRHAYICSLLGLKHVVVAVNKIDLAEDPAEAFRKIGLEFHVFAAGLGFTSIALVPVSARYGDNVTAPSPRLDWYQGPTLLGYLETLDVEQDRTAAPLRFPVQWVNRPDAQFRGYAGTVASGVVRAGDRIVVAGSGRETTVARIVTMDGDLAEARAGDAVTLTLADEVDVARGEVLAAPDARPEVADQFAAHVLWMAEEELLPGRPYLMRIGTATVPVRVTALKHKVDVNTLEHLAARTLHLNEVGLCNLSTSVPVALDPYAEFPATGGFVLVDRTTNATVGAGMVSFALRRATNVHRQALTVDRVARERLNAHRAAAVWFTGLSGSGKSTVANLLEQKLHALGVHTYLLDGDNVRHGLNRDLGFTDVDRVENIRRVGEVTKLMTDAGLVVLCSFISPFRAERQMVRELFTGGEFVEVFVDTPLEECIRRDPKGLYARAQAGKLKNFTGIDSPYEAPEAPEVHLHAGGTSPEAAADELLAQLKARGILLTRPGSPRGPPRGYDGRMSLDPALEALARQLEQHPDYRVLRRLDPSVPRPALKATQVGRAAIVDTETTGTDPDRDKIIELAIIVFEYDRDTGEVGPVVDRYTGFEDPGMPIPPESTAIHHITDDMVAGQKLDEGALIDALRGVGLIIAHNAFFDRRFLERRFPLFETQRFGCSQYDVDWTANGISSHKLEYLAYRAGFFYEGHRAEVDCHALLEVLAQPLGDTGGPALKALLESARQPSMKLWANDSPFETKDVLRARGYRWDAQERAWNRELREPGLEAELAWLRNAVYRGRSVLVNLDVQDARGRYSGRIGERQRVKV